MTEENYDPTLEIQDPKNPGKTTRILRANFDPSKHARADIAVPTFDLGALDFLNKPTAAALREAELDSAEAILAANDADFVPVSGVGPKTVVKLREAAAAFAG